MKSIIYSFAFLTLLSCGKEQHDPRADTMDQFMHGQAEHFKFNGNVLVTEKGKVIFQHSLGVRDYYTNEPLNDSSVFELASVSKQFTAMSILILEKQGKLKLTDSLRQYFPELPYSNITLHHMLTHTSGLPDYEAAMNVKWDPKKIAFNNDMISFLAKEKLPVRFEPGTHWEYSNTAFAVLASITEKVSGMSYKDFMEKNVFAPLAMTHSRVYNTRRSGERLENYAYGFVWSDSLHRYVLPDSLPDYNFVYYLDGIQGDGIINSTTGDLLKWDRALVNKTLIGEATTTKMIFPHALYDTVSKAYYGYGVFVGKNHFGNYVNHSGGWPGYATNLARYVDEDRTIIVLSNNQSASGAIQATLSAILFGQSIELPYQHQAVTLDSAALDQFIGSFSLRNSNFEIKREKDTLVQVYESGYKIKFVPESSTKIFSPDEDIQFEITAAANDRKYYRIFFGVKEEIGRK